MTTPRESATATVRRYELKREEAILAVGEFRELLDEYEAHIHRWQETPDPLCLIMMRQALGAAALHLSCRPGDQHTAWTLNINQPPLNVFVAGSAGDGTVVGRVYTEDVKAVGASRLFVETRRLKGEPTRSVIEVSGYDVLEIFEQYHAQSEQNPARYFEFNETRYGMVLAMPDTDLDWLNGLDRESANALLEEEPRLIDEAPFVFRCGCDPDRIRAVVKNMFGDQPDELFAGDGEVEVSCPRCGRRWTISRAEFDREGEGS